MKTTSNLPKTYESFTRRYPKLKEAWEKIAEAGKDGPLDEKTMRLVKLAVAIGSLKEGAVHASIRKALDLKVSRDEIEQVISLAAGTIGLPSTVAVYSWASDLLRKRDSAIS